MLFRSRGKLPINSEVEILGIREAQKTTVTGIEMFHKSMDEAWAGENCGLLLRGTRREDVERGQVVCKPGSITPHTEFEGHVYILTKDEGGRHNPFYSNYRRIYLILWIIEVMTFMKEPIINRARAMAPAMKNVVCAVAAALS